MKTNRLALLTCLAIALSGPTMAIAGSDDHGGGTNSGSGQSGSNSGNSGSNSGNSSSNSGNSGGVQAGDDHGGGTNSGSGQSGSNSGNSGSNSGNSGGVQAGDDHGAGAEPGDDRGGAGQTGDDHGNGGQTASFQRIDAGLAMMPAASMFGLTGNVDIRSQGNQQRVKVEIEGNFADGTQFLVLANGTPIGSITGRLHHGELEVEVENGASLPGGVQAGAISSIEVRDFGGSSLLLGRFAAIAGAPTSAAPAGGFNRSQAAFAQVSAKATTVGASGQAELRAQGAQQELKIRVDADVADGTVWPVLLNGIQVGTLKFHLKEAEFQIESETPLPAGLGSLANVSTVTITDGTSTMLSASLK